MSRAVKFVATCAVASMLVHSVVLGGTPPSRISKDVSVNFYFASITMSAGYQKMMTDGGDTLFVSPQVLFNGNDVVSAVPGQNQAGGTLSLSLTSSGGAAVGKATRSAGDTNLAIVANNKLVAAPSVQIGSNPQSVTVTGLTAANADILGRVLSARTPIPVGPSINLSASSSSIQPGGLVTVDVYGNSLTNLRTYQVTLAANGGASGELVMEDAQIDKTRKDYVLGSGQVIEAVDMTGARMGGMLINGGVTVNQPGHMGSYNFRASPDAKGVFTIEVLGGENSFMINADNQAIEFHPGAVTVTVGTPGRVLPAGK